MPPELREILLLGIVNPATLIVGYWLGRRADQLQKAVVAGFVAGLAGTVFAWLLMRLGYTPDNPRLHGGIFVTSLLAGTAWAGLGYWLRNLRG